jgi:ribosomal protein S18 acetylase RimI-like enzyme
MRGLPKAPTNRKENTMGALTDHRRDRQFYQSACAKVTFTREGADWDVLADIYARPPLAVRMAVVVKRAFANSYLCCFASVDGQLVGAARATSDGVFNATVLDVAVNPGFQGAGISRKMMRELLRRLPVQKVYLTTTPGKEDFYEKLGFLHQTNAMGLFPLGAREEAVELGVLVE